MSDRHCLSCDYDLTALPAHRCPECGRAFDPDDPTSFAVNTDISGVGELTCALAGWAMIAFPPLGLMLLGASFASSLSLICSCRNPTTVWLMAGMIVSGAGLLLYAVIAISLVTHHLI